MLLDLIYKESTKKFKQKCLKECSFLFSEMDDITTVLLSGTLAPKRILLFNWTSMAYILQSSVLISDHSGGACAMLKGTKGETLVAIAGGHVIKKILCSQSFVCNYSDFFRELFYLLS